MKHSARLADPMERPKNIAFEAALAVTEAMGRNPAPVGAVTAFLVTFAFVAANAVWYQPHAHKTTFFATRTFDNYVAPKLPEKPQTESRIRIEREQAVKGDPAIGQVQAVLSELKLYSGPVDGVSGPQTRKAIETYQRIVGLTPTGKVDAALLKQLNASSPKTASIPTPSPAQRDAKAKPAQGPEKPVAAKPGASSELEKIQAGLKSFGNDQITIDGRMGARTEAAISEFQALFGLEQTGKPNAELLAKMKEIGLVN